jgi:hypothetical protein
MKYETLEQAQAAGVAPWDLTVDRLTDFHVAVFQDRYPVTQGHLLFVPQYNTDEVITDCFESAMRHGRRMVEMENVMRSTSVSTRARLLGKL